MNIANTLTELRVKRGLTQEEVAEQIEVKRARYNSWENGIARPNIEMVVKLANFYKVSTDFLLESHVVYDSEESEIRSLQFAARNMKPEDRKKMINAMKILFESAFNEDK